ncbi:DNA primase [Marispirochaeta sp.]|uniref:DNA primase n=1 Tax=Marispirochaeta sp. TaxID=2038653 RepID=UPI0029C6F271|nr:DNA primase [Marispirochaeta sp.]
MAIPQAVISEISDKTSMVELVSLYTTLKFSGGQYSGLCPFHSEKTPSFSVNEEKKLFYCFGCHKGGNLFQFVMDMENLNFAEAVRFLGQRAGVEIREDSDRGQETRVGALFDLYAGVTRSFHYLLTETMAGAKARDYLHTRGVSDEIISSFQLGYAPKDPDWLHDFLIKKGYSPDFLAESGLFSRNDSRYPLFRNRLIIPIASNQGRVIAFGGRLLEGEGPKYLNSPETPIFKKSRTLFGLNKAAKVMRGSGRFFLCEGYMDVMALAQAGIAESIAPLGTSFTQDQANLLKRYADKGVVLFDNDDAGQNAASKAVILCAKSGIETSIARVSGGKDPADILEKEGGQALQKSLQYTINSFDYLVEKAMSRFSSGTPEGKHRILSEIAPFLEAQDSAVKRDGYLTRLSDMLEVNVTALTADLSQQTTSSREVPQEQKDPERVGSDLFLMLGVAAYPEHFSYIRQYVNADDLIDQRARQLFIILEDAFRRDELDMNAIAQNVDNEEVRGLIFDKAFSGELGSDPKSVLQDTLRSVRYGALVRRQKEVIRALERAERNGVSHEELKSLLTEKMYLTEELQKLRVRQA